MRTLFARNSYLCHTWTVTSRGKLRDVIIYPCSRHLGPVSISEKTSFRNCRIALKFDSTAAEVPVKFQSDRTIPNTNLAASRLYEILRKDVFSYIETGPCFWHQHLHILPNFASISDVSEKLSIIKTCTKNVSCDLQINATRDITPCDKTLDSWICTSCCYDDACNVDGANINHVSQLFYTVPLVAFVLSRMYIKWCSLNSYFTLLILCMIELFVRRLYIVFYECNTMFYNVQILRSASENTQGLTKLRIFYYKSFERKLILFHWCRLG